jgi:hypothetical protein
MLDPLGFSASLIAVAGLASTALRTSIQLYDFYTELKAANDDIEKFAFEIHFFGSIINMGCDCLERYMKK